jgi:hypothetical protein
MNFFSELKRRNVYKVAVAYAVVRFRRTVRSDQSREKHSVATWSLLKKKFAT